MIEEYLGIPCSALSGANIASEVALDEFSETTIGCRDAADAKMWKSLFDTPMFRVQLTDDVQGVSLAGALKNVVAIAAGMIDGLRWGNNAKSAPVIFLSDVNADIFFNQERPSCESVSSRFVRLSAQRPPVCRG